jgi:hypothetical protein
MPLISTRSVIRAIVVALVVAVLFSLRQGIASESLGAVTMFGLFAVPIAIAVTVIFMLPLLAVMRRYARVHLIEYMLYPAIAVLAISMIPLLLLSPGVYQTLNENGKTLISDGRLVWANLGWMILFNIEPALWAALAGLFFWKLEIRAKP